MDGDKILTKSNNKTKNTEIKQHKYNNTIKYTKNQQHRLRVHLGL